MYRSLCFVSIIIMSLEREKWQTHFSEPNITTSVALRKFRLSIVFDCKLPNGVIVKKAETVK